MPTIEWSQSEEGVSSCAPFSNREYYMKILFPIKIKWINISYMDNVCVCVFIDWLKDLQGKLIIFLAKYFAQKTKHR